jgi:tRNA-specific 2-thiouridylase
MEADGIATGHYVRVRQEPSGPAGLYRGADATKDQSYFLWGLPREALPFLHFPLGDLTKEGVREMARERGLVTADKPESQEICFVPTGDYRDLLEKRLEVHHPSLAPGLFVTPDGRVLGEHRGYAGFTVGQRKGLPGGFPEAMFVLEIRPDTREVVVGPRDGLLAHGVELQEMNWLVPTPAVGAELEVQLRHRAGSVSARIHEMNDGVSLGFHRPQYAVTPGQSGVLFQGDRLLGGGKILRRLDPPALST